MFSLSLLSFIFAAHSVLCQQVVLDNIHNATSLGGKTWSTGSGAVSTGINSCNPLNMSMTAPAVPGRSFSFLEGANGINYFEQMDFRYASNASDPHCITAVLTCQHGEYQYLSNGSLVLTPYGSDGLQQVQDPCAAVSNQITRYNQSITFSQWRIFTVTGGFHLNLYEATGEPVAPMNPIFDPPNMLPTMVLVTPSPTATGPSAKRDLEARNAASRTIFMAGGVSVLVGLGMLTVLL